MTVVSDKRKRDALDRFLDAMDDPDYWRTINVGSESIKLTAEEIDLICRIQKNEHADANFDPFVPYVDFFTGTVMMEPIFPDGNGKKRKDGPSRWEELKVKKIVRAIRKGLIRVTEDGLVQPWDRFYDMWEGETDGSILARRARHIEAPKIPLPGHEESYNPSEEYLMTEEEKKEWEAMDPEDRPLNYIPQKYSAFRSVPGYGEVVKERFGRCLDLLLCPRSIKQKINMDPDDLLPVLPDPRELRPFPTTKSVDFIGHNEAVTAISVDPSGQWLLSASKDCSLRLWDTQTGHCRFTWSFEDVPSSISWNPNKNLFMLAVAVGTKVELIIPPGLSQTIAAQEAFSHLLNEDDNKDKVKSLLKWKKQSKGDLGKVMVIEHPSKVAMVKWHRRGDYFATLSPDAPSGAQVVHVHQVSRQTSQTPFKKMPGVPRSVSFDPVRPQLVLATSKAVRLYDLVKQQLIKKLTPGVNSIADLAIHPSGDHIVAASHDGKLMWFDLDYSSRPYRTLSNHQGAIRSVAVHPSYPLLASGGDDGLVQVIHAMVYADLSSNPLIVPVKSIRDFGGSSVTQVAFHPTQPWLFAAATNGSLSLFV